MKVRKSPGSVEMLQDARSQENLRKRLVKMKYDRERCIATNRFTTKASSEEGLMLHVMEAIDRELNDWRLLNYYEEEFIDEIYDPLSMDDDDSKIVVCPVCR